MSSTNEVTILSTPQEKDDIAPALVKLAAPTEMSSYGEEQWRFLLHAGDVDVLVISSTENNKEDLLGCVLRIRYAPHQAYGMMLVSKEARGRGLAKKLLSAAMGDSKLSKNMQILGTCTSMGKPMYEKMGFQRVSTVTKMSIPCDQLSQLDHPLREGTKVHIDESLHLSVLLQMDEQATGLDRSATLKALYGYPYVKMASLSRDGHVVAAALVTLHTDSQMANVGPLLGEQSSALALLQGIQESTSATKLALIVSDHRTLVQSLSAAGFQTVFELGAMTMEGVPLPGERESYLSLIHPTLG